MCAHVKLIEKSFISRSNEHIQTAHMYTLTNEVCKNKNIIFLRETQKHFFIRAAAKHKKGRNLRNTSLKNKIMVRIKSTFI